MNEWMSNIQSISVAVTVQDPSNASDRMQDASCVSDVIQQYFAVENSGGEKIVAIVQLGFHGILKLLFRRTG